MKKLTAILLGLFGLAAFANATGTIVIDTGENSGNGSGPTATTGGLVWLDPDGNIADATLDTNVNFNLEVLWGTSAGTVNNVLNLDPGGLNSPASPFWLVSQPTGGAGGGPFAGDITAYENGAIFDPNGYSYVVPGEAAGTTIWFQLVGWTGNNTMPDSPSGSYLEGRTAPFAVVLSSNTGIPQADVNNMGALVLSAPEPSLPALCTLGGTAFALFCRRK